MTWESNAFDGISSVQTGSSRFSYAIKTARNPQRFHDNSTIHAELLVLSQPPGSCLGYCRCSCTPRLTRTIICVRSSCRNLQGISLGPCLDGWNPLHASMRENRVTPESRGSTPRKVRSSSGSESLVGMGEPHVSPKSLVPQLPLKLWQS